MVWVGEDGMSFVWDCVDLLCCVCANVDGVPLQKSVKIANSFSLYFAILMGV